MRRIIAVIVAMALAGCAANKTETVADLNAAFNVAAAADAAYAASPGANPKTVADMRQLLAAAQAALITWSNSASPGDQAAASAAVAALVAYAALVPPASAGGGHKP